MDPGERVGVICKEDGKIKVIEYTELPRDLAEKRTESGKLVFRAGNIANHFFSLEFLEKGFSDFLHKIFRRSKNFILNLNKEIH